MPVIASLPSYTPAVPMKIVITCSFEVKATTSGAHADFGSAVGYQLYWTQSSVTTANTLLGVANNRARYSTSWTINVAADAPVGIGLSAASAIGTSLDFYNLELRAEAIKR